MVKEYVMVTQTELYTLAIRALEARIDSYTEKQTEHNREYIEAITEPLKAKAETIKHLYKIETGTEYGG